jgi:hypothetical protein
MMRYAFINSENIVVQVIVGALTLEQQEQFLFDYQKLFGAVAVLPVYPDQSIWVGGVYDAQQGFLPPYQPEPQPEPLPEPQPETEAQ